MFKSTSQKKSATHAVFPVAEVIPADPSAQGAAQSKPTVNWIEAGPVAEEGPAPSGIEGRGRKFTAIGRTDSNCAHCGIEFPKRPSRKTKCSACQGFNYVRKRALDGVRVLLREDEIVELERQDAWERGDGPTFDKQLDRYAAKRAELETQFGSSAKASDVRWGLLNEDVVEFSRRRDWISVRQIYQTMAQNLEIEGSHRRAAVFFMVVFIYDANGAGSVDSSVDWSDAEAKQFRHNPRLDFDRSRRMASPSLVVGGITANLEKAGISFEEAETLFLTEASKFMNAMMPLKPEQVWSELISAIKS